MNPSEISLERGRLRVVIAVSLLTFATWSNWRTAAALNFVGNWLLVGFAVVRRDLLLARLLLFGIVVGFTELAAPIDDRCSVLSTFRSMKRWPTGFIDDNTAVAK
jgi:hypothetical protein